MKEKGKQILSLPLILSVFWPTLTHSPLLFSWHRPSTPVSTAPLLLFSCAACSPPRPAPTALASKPKQATRRSSQMPRRAFSPRYANSAGPPVRSSSSSVSCSPGTPPHRRRPCPPPIRHGAMPPKSPRPLNSRPSLRRLPIPPCSEIFVPRKLAAA